MTKRLYYLTLIRQKDLVKEVPQKTRLGSLAVS